MDGKTYRKKLKLCISNFTLSITQTVDYSSTLLKVLVFLILYLPCLQAAEEYVLGHLNDLEYAVRFIEQMCNLNSGQAWWVRGQMHIDGIGYKKDIDKANQCFYRAAQLDEPRGYASLADSYISGQGFQKNLLLARILYEKAAQLGDGPAQFNAAVMRRDEAKNDEDLKKACMWFDKAVQNSQNIDLRESIEDLMKKTCPTLLKTKQREIKTKE